MTDLTIGQIARIANIQPSAIRYYEQEGLLPVPNRISGQRRYDVSILKRLGLIQLLRNTGFGIKELKLLLGEKSERGRGSSRWREMAQHKVEEMADLITQTEMIIAWLEDSLKQDCIDVENCIDATPNKDKNGMTVALNCGVRQFT